MSPEALLERLGELGVTVRLSGPGRIALSPVALIPDELRPEVVAHKAELVALLEREPSVWQADPSDLAWPSQVGEDPRPDLPDSEVWTALLQLASGDADDPGGTYGRLLGARACGALLQPRGRRWKLAPTIDPSERLSVWADRSDWERDAERWLRPKSREIVALLGLLPPPDEGSRA